MHKGKAWVWVHDPSFPAATLACRFMRFRFGVWATCQPDGLTLTPRYCSTCRAVLACNQQARLRNQRISVPHQVLCARRHRTHTKLRGSSCSQSTKPTAVTLMLWSVLLPFSRSVERTGCGPMTLGLLRLYLARLVHPTPYHVVAPCRCCKQTKGGYSAEELGPYT